LANPLSFQSRAQLSTAHAMPHDMTSGSGTAGLLFLALFRLKAPLATTFFQQQCFLKL
jgi:hypothetical protein